LNQEIANVESKRKKKSRDVSTHPAGNLLNQETGRRWLLLNVASSSRTLNQGGGFASIQLAPQTLGPLESPFQFPLSVAITGAELELEESGAELELENSLARNATTCPRCSPSLLPFAFVACYGR